MVVPYWDFASLAFLMRLGVLTASPIAPFLGAVQIPFIHLLKLVVSNVAPLSQLPTESERACYNISIITYQKVLYDT